MNNNLNLDRNGQLYCDLDGVLADFEQGIKNKFNKYPNELNEVVMWNALRKSPGFYEELLWMPEGKELWQRIKIYNPIILTGCPFNYPSAAQEKLNWCARELGPDIKVITCKTKDKPKYCNVGDILIDDRDIIMEQWIEKGGKYVLYKEGKLNYTIEEIERKIFQ